MVLRREAGSHTEKIIFEMTLTHKVNYVLPNHLTFLQKNKTYMHKITVKKNKKRNLYNTIFTIKLVKQYVAQSTENFKHYRTRVNSCIYILC